MITGCCQSQLDGNPSETSAENSESPSLILIAQHMILNKHASEPQFFSEKSQQGFLFSPSYHSRQKTLVFANSARTIHAFFNKLPLRLADLSR
jgi:hypothetical protein